MDWGPSAWTLRRHCGISSWRALALASSSEPDGGAAYGARGQMGLDEWPLGVAARPRPFAQPRPETRNDVETPNVAASQISSRTRRRTFARAAPSARSARARAARRRARRQRRWAHRFRRRGGLFRREPPRVRLDPRRFRRRRAPFRRPRRSGPRRLRRHRRRSGGRAPAGRRGRRTRRTCLRRFYTGVGSACRRGGRAP
mmetsp:Transcript_32368/g.113933  ORF Transcript_32368/g.113933 Transcript_32368/m.113933 type:complete len:200 (-) Transcript_32368:1719-2318(-)